MKLTFKMFTSFSKVVVFVALSAFFLAKVIEAVLKLQKKEPRLHSFPHFEIILVPCTNEVC